MSDSRPSRWKRVLVRGLAAVGATTLVLSLLMAVAVFSLDRKSVPAQTILELDLEQGLVEHVPDDPVAAALKREQPTVRDMVEALHRAAGDERVVGLVARVGGGGLGLAQVEELRAAVAGFRESGKPAVLFAETFGEFSAGHGAYYLATAFDKVYLQPSGDVGLAGLISETPFFRGTLDKLGVEPRMDHRYEYKNALNTFTEQEMTEAHREAVAAVLRSVHEQLVAGIATGRKLDPEEVRRLIDNGPYFGEEALRAGLVDGLAYRDQVYDSLRAQVGEEAEFLFLPRYLAAAGRPHDSGETVALIYGTGAVQRGESEFDPLSGGSSMGSETVTRAFREAIEDDQVRAILFRVDSPGGSYVASDAIWRETVRAREAGKPVIVSMGNVAGSGGYFVAAAADRIVAHPSTITGSIGVLGGKMVVDELSEKLGVSWGDVRVGGNATMWSALHDYTPEEWRRLQALLDRIYLDFTAKVAQGRGMSRDSVHAIARGRIWSGADARELGLVDELGGFDVALRLAREAAGLEADAPVRLREYPAKKSLVEMLLDRGADSSYPSAMLRTLDAVRPLLQLAQRAGLMGRPGVLTMPDVPLAW